MKQGKLNQLERELAAAGAGEQPRLHVFTHPIEDALYLAGGKPASAEDLQELKRTHDLFFIDYGISRMGFGHENKQTE